MATFNNITAESFAQENLHGSGRKRQRCREAVSCLRCRQKKVKVYSVFRDAVAFQLLTGVAV